MVRDSGKGNECVWVIVCQSGSKLCRKGPIHLQTVTALLHTRVVTKRSKQLETSSSAGALGSVAASGRERAVSRGGASRSSWC